MFHHPNYYKKLRMQYGSQPAISASVRPGSRPKAASLKLSNQPSEASSSKPQALNNKPQASSHKPQAQ